MATISGHLKARWRMFTFLRIFILIPVLCASCNDEVDGIVYESEINQWQYLTQRNGLVSDNINTIFEDSKGYFWIGTNKGISVFKDNEIINYTMGNALLDNNVYAFAEDRQGDIWAGTARGVNIFAGNEWQYSAYFNGAPIYAIHTMQNEAGILIGTGGYGTYHFNYADSAISRFDYIRDCRRCNSINALFQATDESVWIASSQGVRKIRGSYITKFDVKDGLGGNIATTISEDTWGNIWVGTFEGKTISKISGNTISQVTFNNGSDRNFIYGIQEDNDGNLWVGTVGNGLFHYDGAIMKQVSEGPPNSTITALHKDSRGNIWVGTAEGGVAVYITNPHP